MDFHQILPLFFPGSQNNYISHLIISIFIIEEKLDSPEKQSEYFRWGLQSNIDRLSSLKNSYENYQKEFNYGSLDDYLNEIRDCNDILWKARNLTPLMHRGFLFAAKKSRINRLNGYIDLKSIIDKLPDLDELKGKNDLLWKII